MTNLKLFTLAVVACTLVFIGNVNSAEVTVTVATGGAITADGGAPVTARGVCWGLTINPTITGPHTSDGTGMGSFVSTITGLAPNTLYHFRAYGTNSSGTGYGQDCPFTTPSYASMVATKVVTTVTTTSAMCGGDVTSDGGVAVTARGVCWSTTVNPTTANSKTVDGSGVGVFASSISGLTPNTVYHVRAYAINSAGTSYGDDIQFATAQVSLPTITTSPVTLITANRAVSGGKIISNGGVAIVQKGVCWGFGPNPVILDDHTINGKGMGTFVSKLLGLKKNRKYHVRAYAKNSRGVGYGQNIVFTTKRG